MAANTTTTLADMFTSEVLSNDYLLLLADRHALPNHPALYYDGSVDATGSITSKVPHVGLMGYDLPDQLAEGAGITYKAITDASSTVAVARYTKGYDYTDLAKMAQKGRSKFGLEPLAVDAVMSRANQLTALICDVIDGFTVTGGPGTGNDLTVTSVLAVIGALAVNNIDGQAGYMGVIHGQQWSDLIVDGGATLAAGTQQYNPDLANIQTLRGNAYQGTWMGVDWHKSNRVTTANAGADRAGAIFGYGGVIWKEGLHAGVAEDPTNQFLLGNGRVLFERDRTATAATTGYVMHSYLGVSKGVENGITLISDA